MNAAFCLISSYDRVSMARSCKASGSSYSDKPELIACEVQISLAEPLQDCCNP